MVPFYIVCSGKYRKQLKIQTIQQLKYNSEKTNNTQYSKTKLPCFSRLLWHSTRKRSALTLLLPSPQGLDLWLAPLWVHSTPHVANSIQSGQFQAWLTASVHDSWWEYRLVCTVFIQDIHPALSSSPQKPRKSKSPRLLSYVIIHVSNVPK